MEKANTCTRCGSRIRYQRYKISIHTPADMVNEIEGATLCHECAMRVKAFCYTDDILEKIIDLRRLGLPFELICTLLNVEHSIGYTKYATWLDEKAEQLPDSIIGKIGALHRGNWNVKAIAGDINANLRKIDCAFNALGEDLLKRIIYRKLWRIRKDTEEKEDIAV